MGIEKILCFFGFHKQKLFEGSDFEYYCPRCYEPFIDPNRFYSNAGIVIYHQEKYPQLLKKLEIMKNEAKTNIKK